MSLPQKVLSTIKLNTFDIKYFKVIAFEYEDGDLIPISLANLTASNSSSVISGGAINYNNNTGDFVYFPPDLSGYATTTALQTTSWTCCRRARYGNSHFS